jgi:predicted secreted hydrolase
MFRGSPIFVLVGLIVALLAWGVYTLSRPQRPASFNARLSVAEALSGDDSSRYARAFEPRPFSFPADHGPHPEFKTEWWYYTGNLQTAGGRRFGFQLTFFRSALAPGTVKRASAWAATHVFLAHFALTDVGSQRFHVFERFSRAAQHLAGAQAQPFRVWLEDWSAEGAGSEVLPMRLRATEDGVAIDFTLHSAKAPVLQGDRGLSQKGPEPGNASYYYSLTRMPTAGTIQIGDERFNVQGLSWMDREWSTSALSRDQVGWDWFALQLADGREIMFYQLRQRDGRADPFSKGSLVNADGTARGLTRDAFLVDVLDHWQSPRSGARYPSRWRIRIPTEQIELDVIPHLADQELDVSIRYWEGAVRINGTANGQPVSGHGYVELTGYGDNPKGGS